MKYSITALLSILSLSAAQDLCPDSLTLLTAEEYQVTTCLLVDNADSCAGCNQPDGFDVTNNQDALLSCTNMQDQLCSTVRCCEACWQKSQNFAQCFLVEPNWSRNGGLVEDGCVIDCSSYPIGASSPSAPTTDSAPSSPTPASSPTQSPVNTPVPDQNFIQQCQGAANNLNCQITNCMSCGDGGYASLAATQIPELMAPGSFFDCAQMEAALCPEIRCCEACDYKPTELWYQCNVVQSYVELGKADASCKIDCSSYASGTGDGSDSSPTSPPAGSTPSGGTPSDSSTSCNLLAREIILSSLMMMMMIICL